MTPNDDKISTYQLAVFVFNIIIGIGILTLPASAAKAAENDGWILILISGIICLGLAYLMCYVGERNKDLGFVGTLKKLFGKTIGLLLSIPFILYLIFFASIEIRIFAETAKLYLLPNTPLEFIILPLIFLTVYLARMGVEAIARFFEIITPFIILLIITLILVAIPKSDYSNIRPFFTTPIIKLIKGINVSIFSYAGFEILLVIFPFLRTTKNAFKATSIAFIIIIMDYIIAFIECIAKFGVKETESFIYPVISLIRASQVPGGIIERLEGLLLAFWVTSVFTTLVGLIFMLSVISIDILNQKSPKHIVTMTLPLLYIIALIGDSVAELFEFSDKLMNILGVYTFIILPIIMFIFTKLKGGKVKNES